MDTPGTVWADTSQPQVRVFASPDAEDELTCTQCNQPISNAAFVTDMDNGTVTATHDRCLPEDERHGAQEHRTRRQTLSRLWKRLSQSTTWR